VIEQYDTMVGTRNMSTNAPTDAALVNVKGTQKALALTTDCNSRYVYADPKAGAAIAVAEAARNIACTGARPLAITNCLNFGNPYNPEVYWQFVNAITGMGDACRSFQTPVTGGNVSFYNQANIEGKIEPVFPTPVIGMLGVLEDKANMMTLDFKKKGDVIFLLGECRNDISSSHYLVHYHKVEHSPAPWFDIEHEKELQRVLIGLANSRLIESAHDIAEGGLYVALFESGMPRKLGFDITTDCEVRPDAYLFGESQGRVVVSVSSENESDFIDFMMNSSVRFTLLGHVTKGEMRVDDESYGFMEEAMVPYLESLENALQGK
jgi:phosphoribosylformylglycinamidine synthase